MLQLVFVLFQITPVSLDRAQSENNMVLTTWSLLARVPLHTNPFFGRHVASPDKFWKRRAIYLQTGHFFGRGRNCFVQASLVNLRALTYVR
jgi:hypothetical protein